MASAMAASLASVTESTAWSYAWGLSPSPTAISPYGDHQSHSRLVLWDDRGRRSGKPSADSAAPGRRRRRRDLDIGVVKAAPGSWCNTAEELRRVLGFGARLRNVTPRWVISWTPGVPSRPGRGRRGARSAETTPGRAPTRIGRGRRGFQPRAAARRRSPAARAPAPPDRYTPWWPTSAPHWWDSPNVLPGSACAAPPSSRTGPRLRQEQPPLAGATRRLGELVETGLPYSSP